MSKQLTVIVCGAPLAGRTPELLSVAIAAGWAPSVIGTPASAAWLDPGAVTRLTGGPPRFAFRDPSQSKRQGDPAAVLVCPATFNTINKAAAGMSDTYALAALCEGLGSGVPTVVVPMVNDKLAGHPAWSRSLEALAECGATFVDIHDGVAGTTPVQSGRGGEVVAAFDPAWAVAALPR